MKVFPPFCGARGLASSRDGWPTRLAPSLLTEVFRYLIRKTGADYAADCVFQDSLHRMKTFGNNRGLGVCRRELHLDGGYIRRHLLSCSLAQIYVRDRVADFSQYAAEVGFLGFEVGCNMRLICSLLDARSNHGVDI